MSKQDTDIVNANDIYAENAKMIERVLMQDRLNAAREREAYERELKAEAFRKQRADELNRQFAFEREQSIPFYQLFKGE